MSLFGKSKYNFDSVLFIAWREKLETKRKREQETFDELFHEAKRQFAREGGTEREFNEMFTLYRKNRWLFDRFQSMQWSLEKTLKTDQEYLDDLHY